MAGHAVKVSSSDDMRLVMGPEHIDLEIRQAISTCWMMLPDEKKTIEALETEIRRIVDRALKDFREDAAAFGIPKRRWPKG